MKDQLKLEYAFEYQQAKPNRFAVSIHQGRHLAVLDPDIVDKHRESSEVNDDDHSNIKRENREDS